jgi:hypothetical protein
VPRKAASRRLVAAFATRTAWLIDGGGTDVSPNINDLAPRKLARITGGLYAAYIVASVLATALGQIGLGSAPQVYQAIATNEGAFRLGLVIALISGFLFLMVA